MPLSRLVVDLWRVLPRSSSSLRESLESRCRARDGVVYAVAVKERYLEGRGRTAAVGQV